MGTDEAVNFLLLVYDSCRYDVFRAANTPVLDAYTTIHCAESPANFSFAAHQAFFVGIFPNVNDDLPYYNRFRKQLLGLGTIGEIQVAKNALKTTESTWNVVDGLRSEGYQTVGTGAVNWFRQDSLRIGFDKFLFTAGTDGDRQIDFLLANIETAKPFFAFINFRETHAPYDYRGKTDVFKGDVRARRMSWPPIQKGPVGAATDAFKHQMAAAEFLDASLPRLFAPLPGNTIVILTADHGECFGEDGYWGHGVNHPFVYQVPLAIFRLDRQPMAE